VIVLPPSRWGGIDDNNPQVSALAPGAGLVLAWRMRPRRRRENRS
jgi:hypothetical protein